MTGQPIHYGQELTNIYLTILQGPVLETVSEAQILVTLENRLGVENGQHMALSCQYSQHSLHRQTAPIIYRLRPYLLPISVCYALTFIITELSNVRMKNASAHGRLPM